MPKPTFCNQVLIIPLQFKFVPVDHSEKMMTNSVGRDHGIFAGYHGETTLISRPTGSALAQWTLFDVPTCWIESDIMSASLTLSD